jgi:peptide chain release factor subunit 1
LALSRIHSKEEVMFDEQDLSELVEFRSDRAPVLSVYLNVDPTQRTTDQYKLTLRSLLKQAAAEAEPADVEAVERYFDFEYDWQGKGVVCFSCDQAELWQAFSLAVPIEDGAFVGDRPYIKPLTDLMDRHEPYGVALVDREGARLFRIHMGEVTRTAGTLGEETRRHKQGGWAAQKLQRHEDVQAGHNLRSAANVATDFFQQGQCARIVLAGTDETVSQFRELLPRVWQERVVGTTPMDMNASEVEVLNKSRVVIRQALADEQDELVERVVTAAAKGGGSAVGLADTLIMLQEERIHTLVVAEGFSAPGYRCESCGSVTADIADACPYCGGRVNAIDDVVEYAVTRMLELGGHVESVRDNPSLVEAGSIGAVLRY